MAPGQLCREYAELSEGEEVRPVVGDDGALSGAPDHFEDLRFRRENVEVVEQRLKREKKTGWGVSRAGVRTLEL